MKLDLGGGRNPKPGFINVDHRVGTDIVEDHMSVNCNLNYGLSCFDDNSVDEFYSSHCFEHVSPLNGLLADIARVGKLGAPFELRVPHQLSDMAMCPGHKHVIGPTQVRHWTQDYVDDWFPGPRYLRLISRGAVPAQPQWNNWINHLNPGTLQDPMTLDFWELSDIVPGIAHENILYLEVAPNSARKDFL